MCGNCFDAVQAENLKLKKSISEEPRTKTLLPDWWQRLWQACVSLSDKADLKHLLKHMEKIESRCEAAEKLVEELQEEKNAALVIVGVDPADWASTVVDAVESLLKCGSKKEWGDIHPENKLVEAFLNLKEELRLHRSK
jgi:hypothetical protein